jgi:hypothetical protein
MIRTTKDVLSEKKGMAEALGFAAIAMTIILAAAAVVANYGIHSRQAGELQTVTQEISNRGAEYASGLNADLTSPQVPSMARECSSTTKTCTQILSVTPSSDGNSQVLRIQGDGATTFGQSLTQDVTLKASTVTHVTAIDSNGDNVWANSGEGLQYKAWSVASGKASDVTADELSGPTSSNNWVSIADRAGIDSKGSLWVWGPNGSGQAGIGSTSGFDAQPTRVNLPGVSFRSVVTDDQRGIAIDANGYAYVWGFNTNNDLGASNPAVIQQPTKIPNRRWQKFALGNSSTYGLSMAGDIFMLGQGTFGVSQSGTTDEWTQINKGIRFTDIAANQQGVVATVDETGKLRVYASDRASSGTYSFTPNDSIKFASVSLGETAGYGLAQDGTLYSWGTNTYGQLGTGEPAKDAATPTKAVTPAGAAPKFVSVNAGQTDAVAIDVNGQLYVSGTMTLGPGSASPWQSFYFQKMASGGRTYRAADTNTADTTTALLDSDNNVYALGTDAGTLWVGGYAGSATEPSRMGVPAGFSSYTWK